MLKHSLMNLLKLRQPLNNESEIKQHDTEYRHDKTSASQYADRRGLVLCWQHLTGVLRFGFFGRRDWRPYDGGP